jgi:hypothetical protein
MPSPLDSKITSNLHFVTVLAVVLHVYVSSIAPDFENYFTEWCTWCLIWLGCRIRRLVQKTHSRDTPELRKGYNVTAFLVALGFSFQRGHNISWIIPLLGPLVVVISARLSRDYDLVGNGEPTHGSKWYLRSDAIYFLIAIVTSVAMFPDMGEAAVHLPTYGFWIVIGIAIAFTGHNIKISDQHLPPGHIIEQISLRVLALLSFAVLNDRIEILELSTFVPSIISRSLFWVGLLQMVSVH